MISDIENVFEASPPILPSFLALPMNLLLATALLLLCSTLFLRKQWKRVKVWWWRYAQLERFAGPVAYPIIGTVGHMVTSNFYEWSASAMEKWGDPLRLWKLWRPMVIIGNYDVANQLLSKSNFNGKFADIDMIYRQYGGKGLSTTPAALHPHRRKLLSSAFTRQIIEASVESFSEDSERLVERLEEHANSGNYFGIVKPIMKGLFRMVARRDFGDAFIGNISDEEVDAHIHAFSVIAKNMTKRMVSPEFWKRNDFIYYNFTEEGKQTSGAQHVLNSSALRAIGKRKTQRDTHNDKKNDEQNQSGSCDSSASSIQERCFLDVLLDLRETGQLTTELVVSELNNFLGGAYDTTALTVSWTLLLLALNPEHQKKVYEEACEIFGPHPTKVRLSASSTKQMKYLELCLKESLRLFPPAPVFPRSTVNDMKLSDGRIIPGGVDVLIFSNVIHRDPRYFPEPLEFRPERHLEPIPAFIPFSLGVRNCIGQQYGMYQAKVVLAHLIREYKWKTNAKDMSDVKIAYQGLLYPEDEIYCKITRRR